MMMGISNQDITQDVLNGKRRAVARALTWVENRHPQAEALLAELYPYTGHAQIIGVTGAPGTGKSSLVNMMTKVYRQQGKTVGIVAIDPTSPFSGGAILGDRIRMKDHSGDEGVFIRSMAARGSLGGLSVATRDGIRVLDAAGFDVIIVETVGAGQNEVDIVRTAHTTIVVEAPGMGDDVQAIKAGIMEIADILVVNKSDRPGASGTVRALKTVLEITRPISHNQLFDHHSGDVGQHIVLEHAPTTAKIDSEAWIPPVIQTVATEIDRVEPLIEAIEAHQAYLQQADGDGELEAQRLKIELVERLQAELLRQIMGKMGDELLFDLITQVQKRTLTPQQAVQQAIQTYYDPKTSPQHLDEEITQA
jgi:LAO/AO transport system kinase